MYIYIYSYIYNILMYINIYYLINLISIIFLFCTCLDSEVHGEYINFLYRSIFIKYILYIIIIIFAFMYKVRCICMYSKHKYIFNPYITLTKNNF